MRHPPSGGSRRRRTGPGWSSVADTYSLIRWMNPDLGNPGYLTLPGGHGRMTLHGLRGEGGLMEQETSPLTVAGATRSRMQAFRLPFLREGKAGHMAWFAWAA